MLSSGVTYCLYNSCSEILLSFRYVTERSTHSAFQGVMPHTGQHSDDMNTFTHAIPSVSASGQACSKITGLVNTGAILTNVPAPPPGNVELHPQVS